MAPNRTLYHTLPPLALLVSLAACDLPSPLEPVAGVPARHVTIEGSTFSVRTAGDIAVAVRTNFDIRARSSTILPRAGLAIEQVSGCKLRTGTLKGDAARIEAKISC